MSNRQFGSHTQEVRNQTKYFFLIKAFYWILEKLKFAYGSRVESVFLKNKEENGHYGKTINGADIARSRMVFGLKFVADRGEPVCKMAFCKWFYANHVSLLAPCPI